MENSTTDILSAIGQLSGAIISIAGFYFLWKQIKLTNKNLQQSNHTAIYSINTDLYKFFAEHSDLRPYFHEEKHLSLKDENRNKVFSLCELLADFFEYILIEKDALAPEIIGPWKNYIKKIYIKSSAFREFIKLNNDQYSEKLLTFLNSVIPDFKQANITVREIENDTEFAAVDNLYQSCFGSKSVPTEIQKYWWQSYKQGIKGLFINSQIIGAFSFWPISKEAFNALSSGKCQEKDIKIENLLMDITTHKYYYLSEIAIAQEFRKQYYSTILLSFLIKQFNVEFKILALGFSEGGKKIMDRLGFVKILNANDTPDQQDLYLLDIESVSEIELVENRLVPFKL